MSQNLEGRVALVTGASRETGTTVAERLAEVRANVAVDYGHDAAAEEVGSRVVASGRTVTTVGSDERPGRGRKDGRCRRVRAEPHRHPG